MGMLEIFYPDETADTSYGIDYEALYRKGYRGLIYDVDNTLVPHGAPADDRAKALFERLHTIGFSAVLLSNNKEPRVKSFAEDVKYADYIFKADKPSVKGYEEAMRRMGTRLMNKFMLNITASSGEYYQGDCEDLVLPISDGVYGIQAGHSPVLVAIHMGILHFEVNGESQDILVGDGIAEVTPAYVMVLVDSAERPEDID